MVPIAFFQKVPVEKLSLFPERRKGRGGTRGSGSIAIGAEWKRSTQHRVKHSSGETGRADLRTEGV